MNEYDHSKANDLVRAPVETTSPPGFYLPNRKSSQMRRFLRRPDIGIIIGWIFLFVLFSLWNPQQWFNWGTIKNICGYTAILGLLSIGQTFVILISRN
jgi:hypothetical protein